MVPAGDVIKKVMDRDIKWALDGYALGGQCAIDAWLAAESPIEMAMGDALARLQPFGQRMTLASGRLREFDAPDRFDRVPRVELWCQPWFFGRTYRTDFQIIAAFAPGPVHSVIVECDGRRFHQNFGADYKRDRALAAAGHLVVRFTGSEIHADPVACADEVRRIVEGRETVRARGSSNA